MGTFGAYRGNFSIPKEQHDQFAENVMKLLYYGGMMQIEDVKMFGYSVQLLKPLELDQKGEAYFRYNYFEDDAWVTARFSASDLGFSSDKIGSREFNDVITAVNVYYKLCDQNVGIATIDEDIVAGAGYVGWINHILGTDFSMKKWFRLWENAEAYIYNSYRDTIDATRMLPRDLLFAAGGVELTDLLYICHGTDTLVPEQIEDGTYPADVYQCKQALAEYFEKNPDETDVETLWELLKKDRAARTQCQSGDLTDIAVLSLKMPARVFVYLTAEKKNKNFWTEWEQLKDAVYHDEIMKQYADRQLTELRNSTIEKPVPPQLTSSFLKQSDRFVFYDTPKELKDKPKFYICDDDRLYWWGGSEEVRISEETDSWLKGLAERHQKIIEQMADEPADHTAFLKEILKLMDEINSTYGRIMLFQNLFYELVMHLNEKEYRALVLLLKELAEENREEGAAIEFLRGSWDINSRAITHNIGRIRLKRYISMIANEKLRKVYFGF